MLIPYFPCLWLLCDHSRFTGKVVKLRQGSESEIEEAETLLVLCRVGASVTYM